MSEIKSFNIKSNGARKFFNRYLPMVLSVVLVAAALSAYLILQKGTPQAEADWYSSGGTWSYRKALTVDHTKVNTATSTTTPLSNFPVLYSKTDTDLKTIANGGKVGMSDGSDIVFTASDGTTLLNYEIESYASTTGQIIAWIKIPSLSSTADTTIYEYFGNPSAPAETTSNKQNTWSNGFTGVWHLPNGTTLSANDSTSYGANGTISGPTATAGQIDGAANYTAAPQLITPSGSMVYATSTAPFTASAWVNLTDYSLSSYPVVVELKTNTTDGWFILLSNQSGYLGISIGASADWVSIKTNNPVSTGGWHHIVVTYNGNDPSIISNFQIYLDDTVQTLVSANGYGDTSNGTTFGSSYDNTNPWYGGIDEVEFSSVARNSDWIATQYNNQNSPSTFFSSTGVLQTPVTNQIGIRGGNSASKPSIKFRGGNIKFR